MSEILNIPGPRVREESEIGRYLRWLEAERQLSFPDYDSLRQWSVTDLEGVRPPSGSSSTSVRTPAHRRPGPQVDAGHRVVPGRDPQLRRARPRARGFRRGRRRRRGRRPLPDAGAGRADLRRAPRPGRPGPRRAPPPRRPQRRPGRRRSAEHPRDARRLPRHGEHRRGLGGLRTGVRAAQRRRPLRPARTEGAAHRRRLPLRGAGRRPPYRGRGDRGAAPDRGAGRPRPLRPAHRARRPGLGGAARGAGHRSPRLRTGAVRPPAVRAVLLRHHGHPQGDRPPPRRDPP
ncbi:hypothetical protein SNARM312S_03624 [Streptomyces narbonensis]